MTEFERALARRDDLLLTQLENVLICTFTSDKVFVSCSEINIAAGWPTKLMSRDNSLRESQGDAIQCYNLSLADKLQIG